MYYKMSANFSNKSKSGMDAKVQYADVAVVVKSKVNMHVTDVMFHDGSGGMGYSLHPDEQWPVEQGAKTFINFISRGDTVIVPMQSYFTDNGYARTDEMKTMQSSQSSIQKLVVSKAQSRCGLKIGYNCSDTPTATNIDSLEAGKEYQMNDYAEVTTNRTTFGGRPPIIGNYDNKIKIQGQNNARVSGVLYFNDGLAKTN